MEGNMNTGFTGVGGSWVLGLPAQTRDGARRSRQRRITQRRLTQLRGSAPVVGSESSGLSTNYAVDVIVINAGEGIGEKVHSYFQVRERFPSHFRDHSCLGVILSAEGTVYSPRMNIQGSAVVYEGLHEIVKLSGFYFMPKNGQVQLSGSLKMTFCDPDGGVFGGLVIGSLIAATSLQSVMSKVRRMAYNNILIFAMLLLVQVAVLTFIHDV